MTQGSKVCFGDFPWLKAIHDAEVAGRPHDRVPDEARRAMVEHGLVRETAQGLEMTNKGYRLVSEQD